MGSANAFSTGTVSLAGTTLLSTIASPTIANALVFSGGSANTFTGTNGLNFSGPATLLAGTTLDVANATTFSGIIGESNSQGLTVGSGIGTLTLGSPNNWFSGGATLNNAVNNDPLGTLVVAGAARWAAAR